MMFDNIDVDIQITLSKIKLDFRKLGDWSMYIERNIEVYFMDTGLAAYLCRWPNAETLQNRNMDGAFLRLLS